MDLTDPWEPFCIDRGLRRTSGIWGLRMKSMVHARIAAVRASWGVSLVLITQARLTAEKDDSLLLPERSKR
jgi:hypothetical protein